eukprot:362102-Chlamydomonas_euryale.AAC.1
MSSARLPHGVLAARRGSIAGHVSSGAADAVTKHSVEEDVCGQRRCPPGVPMKTTGPWSECDPRQACRSKRQVRSQHGPARQQGRPSVPWLAVLPRRRLRRRRQRPAVHSAGRPVSRASLLGPPR